MLIDWTDRNEKISKFFTVGEALWLPRVKRMHIPNLQQKTAIVEMAQHMDMVREFLGGPIIVHCWLRPTVINAPDSPHNGQNYNKMVGGSEDSWHTLGLAVDFHVRGLDDADGCKIIRDKLVPKLAEFNIRMEDKIGPWVHVDRGYVGHNRFFKP